MTQQRTRPGRNAASARTRLGCAGFALLAGLAVGSVGCGEDVSLADFRTAAASSLESGVKSILDGLVEGFFAVFVQGDGSTTTG